ncbi:hypothetical protein BGZ93_002730, partial [Podila epicladia]
MCTLIQPSHADEVAQVLGSVQWLTLKSLVLLGNYINEWIELWPTPCDSRLFHFHIRGATSRMQGISHSSVLFLQRLIFSSPLVDLRLRNIQLQDRRDWALLIHSIDISFLQTLDLDEHGATQFLSEPNAVDLFISGLEATHSETEGAKLILPSLTLDSRTMSQADLARVRVILRHCILERLIVKSDPADHKVPDPVVKVLDSVQLSLLERLISGDDIKHWMQRLIRVDAPRLKTLQMLGTKSVQQELSTDKDFV